MLRVFRSTKLRYLLVGIAAFALGSATIGAAAATSDLGSLFYTTILNGQPTKPCSTETTGQGSTTVCNAIVDSNGNLHVASQGTTSVNGTVKLDPTGNTVQLASGTTIGVNFSQSGSLSVANVHDGQNIYQGGDGCELAAPLTLCAIQLGSGIPPGERLVIETVTANVSLPAGVVVASARINGPGPTIFLTPSKFSSDGTIDNWGLTQQLRAYETNSGAVVDPLFCAIQISPLPVSDLASIFCNIQGYLVTPA